MSHGLYHRHYESITVLYIILISQLPNYQWTCIEYLTIYGIIREPNIESAISSLKNTLSFRSKPGDRRWQCHAANNQCILHTRRTQCKSGHAFQSVERKSKLDKWSLKYYLVLFNNHVSSNSSSSFVTKLCTLQLSLHPRWLYPTFEVSLKSS